VFYGLSGVFSSKKLKNILHKNLEVKKKYLPLQSQTKNGVHNHSRFGNDKFIEKTDLLYKKQVPRKTIYREASILLKRIESVRTD